MFPSRLEWESQMNVESMKVFHSLSKCSMLKPIVGTEIDFRSSLFLKKFTIVDFPELLRPIIRMLICFGFLSLFKIFINNFSNTIALPATTSSGMIIFGFSSLLSSLFNVLMEILNVSSNSPLKKFFLSHETRRKILSSTTLKLR